jgi:uncharacterized protein (TIGR03435 family)
MDHDGGDLLRERRAAGQLGDISDWLQAKCAWLLSKISRDSMTRTRAALLLTAALLAGIVRRPLAQPAAGAPAFEAVSVKRNTAAGANTAGGGGFQPGGRFVMKNASARLLIQLAFGDPQPLSREQVVNGPAWAESDGFDVQATAPAEFADPRTDVLGSTAGPSMLQALLRDRFKLAAHVESRRLSVFALTFASNDRRLGPRLKLSAPGDCVSAQDRGSAPAQIPTCGSYLLQFVDGHFHIHAVGITMERTAKNMRNLVERIVVLGAAPAGSYNFDLDFAMAAPGRLPSDVSAADAAGDAPPLFTAVREQLGLRFEATTAPVDVVVIDRIERPAED